MKDDYGAMFRPMSGKWKFDDDEASDKRSRLIAAAPDLLDACVRLLDAVARGDHKAKAIDGARAAVAKATGDKP